MACTSGKVTLLPSSGDLLVIIITMLIDFYSWALRI
jgi:hypothetical protein